MSEKTVLITGANKGIGFEIARQLGKIDFKVFLTARNEARGQQAAEKLKSQNIDAVFVQLDVTDPSSVDTAFEQVREKCTRIDVLINNAAINIGKGDILDMSISTLRQTIDTNVYGVIEVTRKFLPLMRKGGRIINVSSDLGSLSQMGSYAPAYSISKTMLNAVTKQFAGALEKRGISVNSVHPGWVQTDMGGSRAPVPVEKGAETAVWLATEAPQSLTGKFLHDKKEMAW